MKAKNDWITALEDLNRETCVVPDGWLTIGAVQKLWAIGEGRARRQMKELIKVGKAEKQSFRMLTSGVVRFIPHYRLIKKK